MSQNPRANAAASSQPITPRAGRSALRARGLLSGLCLALLTILASLPAQAVDLDQQVKFDIRPQGLSAALIQFSHQTRIQIIVSDDIRGRTTRGICGVYAIGDALRSLLLGSGLYYRVASDTSIVIGRRGGSAATSRKSSSAR